MVAELSVVDGGSQPWTRLRDIRISGFMHNHPHEANGLVGMYGMLQSLRID